MGIMFEINPIGAVLTETQQSCKATAIQILAHGNRGGMLEREDK